MRTRLTVLAAALMAACCDAPSSAQDWPQFRGPTAQGTTVERGLPLTWGGPAAQNVLWKAPLKGSGHASPIVWGDRVFVCTAYWPPSTASRETTMPEHHLACYRASDGVLQWDALIPPGPWLRSDFRSGAGGGYAAPTPCTDGKLVYCAFGSSVLAAVDFQGRLAWRREIVPYTHDVTLASSPVLYKDTVILFCPAARAGDSRITAFDAATGATRWERKLPEMGFGHSTPVVVTIGGKPQMLVCASGMHPAPAALRSLDPASGADLWWCRAAGDVTSPVYAGGLVYADSGRSGLGVAVDPTGTGDVSATHVKWTVNGLPEGLSSPVAAGGYLYRLLAPGLLRCFEIATGKVVYTERLEGVTSTWASPIVDPDGRIYIATAGRSFVVQAGPQFRILATNDLGDPNDPSPAVSRGRLYLAGQRFLTCIGRPGS